MDTPTTGSGKALLSGMQRGILGKHRLSKRIGPVALATAIQAIEREAAAAAVERVRAAMQADEYLHHIVPPFGDLAGDKVLRHIYAILDRQGGEVMDTPTTDESKVTFTTPNVDLTQSAGSTHAVYRDTPTTEAGRVREITDEYWGCRTAGDTEEVAVENLAKAAAAAEARLAKAERLLAEMGAAWHIDWDYEVSQGYRKELKQRYDDWYAGLDRQEEPKP